MLRSFSKVCRPGDGKISTTTRWPSFVRFPPMNFVCGFRHPILPRVFEQSSPVSIPTSRKQPLGGLKTLLPWPRIQSPTSRLSLPSMRPCPSPPVALGPWPVTMPKPRAIWALVLSASASFTGRAIFSSPSIRTTGRWSPIHYWTRPTCLWNPWSMRLETGSCRGSILRGIRSVSRLGVSISVDARSICWMLICQKTTPHCAT